MTITMRNTRTTNKCLLITGLSYKGRLSREIAHKETEYRCVAILFANDNNKMGRNFCDSFITDIHRITVSGKLTAPQRNGVDNVYNRYRVDQNIKELEY